MSLNFLICREKEVKGFDSKRFFDLAVLLIFWISSFPLVRFWQQKLLVEKVTRWSSLNNVTVLSWIALVAGLPNCSLKVTFSESLHLKAALSRHWEVWEWNSPKLTPQINATESVLWIRSESLSESERLRFSEFPKRRSGTFSVSSSADRRSRAELRRATEHWEGSLILLLAQSQHSSRPEGRKIFRTNFKFFIRELE